MRFTRTIAATFLAVLLTVTAAVSTSAQDAPEMPGLDIEGLEKAYGRTFNADIMAMIDTDDPEAIPTGWFMLTTMVLEFDSEDSARDGFEQLNEGAASGATGADVALEEIELDLDVEHSAVQAVEEMGGVTTSVALVTALDGQYVYAVSGITFGDDPVGLVASIVSEMQATEAGDGEETFDAGGASEGGLWDRLPAPATVASEAETLTEVTDIVSFPVEESTPAA